MAGLAIKLAPRERLLINGVVVENGPRRTQLLICSSDAAILRLREAIDADDLIGPAAHAYFAAQQAVAGEVTALEALPTVNANLSELLAGPCDEDIRDLLTEAFDLAARGKFYHVMRKLKPLIDRERDDERQTGA